MAVIGWRGTPEFPCSFSDKKEYTIGKPAGRESCRIKGGQEEAPAK
jgi:hypothetical protein